MPNYRFYLVNEAAKIFRGEDLDEGDDLAAITTGWRLFEEHDSARPGEAAGMEIWREAKRIF